MPDNPISLVISFVMEMVLSGLVCGVNIAFMVLLVLAGMRLMQKIRNRR